MTEKTYIKKDLDQYMPENIKSARYATRKNQIEKNLPDGTEYKTVREGSYQGVMAIIIKLDDYWWFTEDNYGSCTGCDYCRSDPVAWTKDVLKSAYCFKTFEDLKTYVKNSKARQFTSSFESLNREEVIQAAEEMK